MSGDEIGVLIASTAWVGFWWFRHVPLWHRLNQFYGHPTGSPEWLVVTLLGLAVIGVILRTLADEFVVASLPYQGMYLLLGLGWILMVSGFWGIGGVSLRDDVIERGNPAAARALAGLVAGTAILYGLANTGDGPGWWCVVVAAGLAQGTLLLGWLVLATLARWSWKITVERDAGVGLRAGAWLLAGGILLGRGAAGTWTSFEATLLEFAEVAIYFPVLLLAGFVIETLLGSLYREMDDPHPVLSGLLVYCN